MPLVHRAHEEYRRYKHKLSEYNTLEEIPAEVLREAKVLGFSDFQIGRFVLKTKDTNMEKEVLTVRALRKKLNILPAVKRIPTVLASILTSPTIST